MVVECPMYHRIINDAHERPAEYITTVAGEVEDVDWQHFALYKSNNTTVYADDTVHIDYYRPHWMRMVLVTFAMSQQDIHVIVYR